MSEAHEVGPLAEEAAKLLGALSGWAREHAAEASDGLSGLAAHPAASAAHGVDEHLATGAAECTVCPLCRTVHAVRQLSPEVTTHLASADVVAGPGGGRADEHARVHVPPTATASSTSRSTTSGRSLGDPSLTSARPSGHWVRRVRRRPPSQVAPSAHSDSALEPLVRTEMYLITR